MASSVRTIQSFAGAIIGLTIVLLIVQELSKEIEIPGFTFTIILIVFLAFFAVAVDFWKKLF